MEDAFVVITMLIYAKSNHMGQMYMCTLYCTVSEFMYFHCVVKITNYILMLLKQIFSENHLKHSYWNDQKIIQQIWANWK